MQPFSSLLKDCGHDGLEECRCYANPAAAAQSLDELEFVRSACHAAQIGNLDKLQRILASKPDAVGCDGGTGVCVCGCGCSCSTSRDGTCTWHKYAAGLAAFMQALWGRKMIENGFVVCLCRQQRLHAPALCCSCRAGQGSAAAAEAWWVWVSACARVVVCLCSQCTWQSERCWLWSCTVRATVCSGYCL